MKRREFITLVGGVAGGGARGNLRCLGVDDCVEKRMAGG
jgi:hypothetical protein